VSAKEFPGGRTQVLNVHGTKQIDPHAAESDQDGAPELISNNENWLNWNGDLDNPNESEEGCEADDESDMEPDIGINALESQEHWVVSAALNVAGLIRPTWRSMKNTEMGLTTVSAMETRRNKGNRKR